MTPHIPPEIRERQFRTLVGLVARSNLEDALFWSAPERRRRALLAAQSALRLALELLEKDTTTIPR